MKSILLLAILSLFTASCEERAPYVPPQQQSVVKPPEIKYKTVCTVKIIKDLKEVQEQHTSYEERLNLSSSLWNGDLKTTVVPNVHTNTNYYIIYTDHTNEEVSRNTWLNYSKGDTVKKYKQIQI